MKNVRAKMFAYVKPIVLHDSMTVVEIWTSVLLTQKTNFRTDPSEEFRKQAWEIRLTGRSNAFTGLLALRSIMNLNAPNELSQINSKQRVNVSVKLKVNGWTCWMLRTLSSLSNVTHAFLRVALRTCWFVCKPYNNARAMTLYIRWFACVVCLKRISCRILIANM